jgi:DNA-binding MarR family transcriptional regulator
MDKPAGRATAVEAEPVPHAVPVYVTGTGRPVSDEELNQQISEVLAELIRQAHELGQGIAAESGLTVSDTKALFMLGSPMTMKDLGQRLGCDPSFITSVADALEKHGLARREPCPHDRRSKTIVLTPEGEKIRDRIRGELSARAPWCATLDTSERRCLLHLIRKMLRRHDGGDDVTTAAAASS